MSNTNDTTTQAVTIAPTSEKLTEIQAAIVSKKAELKQAYINDDDAATETLGLELFALKQSEKAELSAINKAEIAAKIEAERNKRKAIATDFEAAILANAILQADKKADETAKAESESNLATMREALINELLSGKAATPKAVTSGNAESGKSSAKAGEIVEMYKSEIAAGKNHTEAMQSVIAAGVKRGTAWKPIDDYRKANGLK